MARKKRDYKAEYARTKAKAQASGYGSEREYRYARKALNLPRNASPLPRRSLAPSLADRVLSPTGRRREARAWSAGHSHKASSAYEPDMSAEQLADYHRAFVQRVTGFSRRKGAAEKRRRIAEYMRKWGGLSDSEWKQKYGGPTD